MIIKKSIIKKAAEDVTNVYKDYYKIENKKTLEKLEEILNEHFSRLHDDITVLIETDYVDRMYRDVYYHYFSTKMDSYHRNCIRVSLFNVPIDPDTFYSYEKAQEIRDNQDYLGFYVIRPTFPQVIGRNVISPKALKDEYSGFKTCSTCFSMTARGIKFDVVGFPHASQDGEMVCCADVTIWAIMEYFGNKYPEYSIIPPSKTMSSLKNISFERQLPTAGLSIESISFALREQGLGPKIYYRDEYKDEFENLFSCYIESGIPIAVAVEEKENGEIKERKSDGNYQERKEEAIQDEPLNINHAMICTGHETEDFVKYSKIAVEELNKIGDKIKVFDWDSIKKDYIFVDDNRPVYSKSSFDNPMDYQKNVQITYFLAPLYPKIYLDAHEAKKQMKKYIVERDIFYINPAFDNKIILRMFLTSSRSYKQYIAFNREINFLLQEIILNLELPKFVWVGELSTPEDTLNEYINGIIILDATEPRYTENKSMMLITNSTRLAYRKNGEMVEEEIGECVKIADKYGEFQTIGLPLQPFKRFGSNIKGIHELGKKKKNAHQN